MVGGGAMPSSSPDAERTDGERWPLWKLAIIALPQLGVQLLWVFLGPNTTPYLKYLGAEDAFAAWNNSAGPIVGFFVGPIVGTLSDQSTSKYGRRRPVIVAGLILTLVAGLLYGGAVRMLGRTSGAMYLAAAMQWGLDFTVNVMQTPFRAFVSDLAAADQQFMMQIWFNVVCAVGTYMAYYVMGLYEIAIHHMLELMSIVLVVNVVCVAAALVVGREKPFKRKDEQEGGSACGPLAGFAGALKDLHAAFYILIVVLCLVWFGNTVWGSYGKLWFTEAVYEGDPEAKTGTPAHTAYVEGAEAFSKGGERGALVSLALSFVLMGLSFTPVPHHFIFAPLVFVGAIVCYMCAFSVGHSGGLAILALVLSNIPLGAAGSIPYGIVAVWNKEDADAGKVSSVATQMAILNCCITVGQQMCHTILGTFETSSSAVEAIHKIFILSMVANGVAGVGSLFLGIRKTHAAKSQEPSAGLELEQVKEGKKAEGPQGLQAAAAAGA